MNENNEMMMVEEVTDVTSEPMVAEEATTDVDAGESVFYGYTTREVAGVAAGAAVLGFAIAKAPAAVKKVKEKWNAVKAKFHKKKEEAPATEAGDTPKE